VLIAFIAGGDIRVATRSLLTIEGISVGLIVILVVVIFVRLIAGSTPDGHESSLGDAFSLPSGTTLDAIATAAVFGFLSFAGFEGAATLGEETAEPRRSIPRAVFLAPLTIDIFYFFVILSQTLGFGTGEAGVAAFAGSASPLGDLSKTYVGAGLEDAINLGATLSAFASALGTATAGSRVLFALSRDSLRESHPLACISQRSGAPIGALALVMAVGFAGLIGQRIAGTNAVNAFFRHDRRAVADDRLHRHQPRRDQAPVPRPSPPGLEGGLPGARDRVPGVDDLQERGRHGHAVRPFPVDRARLARDRRSDHRGGAAPRPPHRRALTSEIGDAPRP
jgi:amino acid transporter